MAPLSKEQILAADDKKTEAVQVPEWGGEVLVKGLTGKERDLYEDSILAQDTKGNIRTKLANARAKLVVRAAVDSKGHQLFEDDDIERLGNKSAKALNRVYEKAAEMSGLKDEDLEELVGNSNADQVESSPSD
jgi:hypothetical protein